MIKKLRVQYLALSSVKHLRPLISCHLPFTAIFAACFLTACSPLSRDHSASSFTPDSKTTTPQFIKDPYERVNRGIWAANEGLLKGVIHPSAKVYRATLPKPVRGSIGKFSHNITYPGRLVNNLLQGRWAGMKNETLRFVSNSTVGIGGLFDPATRWGIARSQADSNQTLSKWGWRPETYVMLPLLGPSDERNTVGIIADRALNPLNHLNSPYRSASFLGTYNRLAGRSEMARQLVKIEPDSYSILKYAWTYGSKYEQPDLALKGPLDLACLQTLGAVSIAPKDRNFLASTREVKIKIPTTGRKLQFNYWLQPHSAPLVYILPGLNSHSLSNLPLALAENLYNEGYSVVSTTSVFHPEFMAKASTADLPIYAPSDSRDLLIAVTEMDKYLVRKRGQHSEKRALVGMSMGGFIALNLAIRDEKSDPNLMKFDRYVAINTPVDMVHSSKLVDRFVRAPLAWPAKERQARINNTVHKATANGILSRREGPPIMFDKIESQYLVGLSFRFGLRDIIYSSQIRNDRGVLQTPLSAWKREPVYNEIMTYTYDDYFYKLAAPYYQERGISAKEILRHANLRNHTQKLRRQPKIRILTNRNDFMLPAKDLKWLQSTFSSSQLTVFPEGGHLGNLNDPTVEKAIIKALDGLKDQASLRSASK